VLAYFGKAPEPDSDSMPSRQDGSVCPSGDLRSVQLACGLTVGCECAGSIAMNYAGPIPTDDDLDMCWAAERGDLAEMQRLVGEDPGLLDARHWNRETPLILACEEGQVEVVRWLVDKGAAINLRDAEGRTALGVALWGDHLTVVKLLMEGGAEPAIISGLCGSPLSKASALGRLEVVRLILGHPNAKVIINHRSWWQNTALFVACSHGHANMRALLDSGADPTIANSDGRTSMAIAKEPPPPNGGISAEGRRECVVMLEVRLHLRLFSPSARVVLISCLRPELLIGAW
jgi:uncharacterized protein